MTSQHLVPAMRHLAQKARRATPAGVVDTLQRRIALAGLTDTWPVDRLLAWKLAGGLAGGLFGLVVFVAAPSTISLILVALLGGLGWFAPDVGVTHRADARRREIEHTRITRTFGP